MTKTHPAVEAADLPPLPEPAAWNCYWRGDNDGPSWDQWHDASDPMPAQWEGEAPDEVTPHYTAEQMHAYAREALRATLPGLREVPSGWKWVPVEPTDAMVDATHHGQPVADIYRDMLAAAPSAAGLREVGEPVAHVTETLVGPALSVHGVEVARWLGCCHDAHAHGLAAMINRNAVLAAPPSPAPQPAEPTMSRDELVAAAESIGMRFPAPQPAALDWQELPEHVSLAMLSLAQHEARVASAAPQPAQDGGEVVARESVEDALMIVQSYGPWGTDLNDAHRRQIVLADEVVRLRKLYEMAVTGRAQMRTALRQARAAPPTTKPAAAEAGAVEALRAIQRKVLIDPTHAGTLAEVALLAEAALAAQTPKAEAKLHQSAINSLSSRCEHLTMTQQLFIAERDAAQEHAALYWWLRNDASDWDAAGIIRLLAGPDYERLSGAELDAAIRAAMKGEP